MQVLRTRGATLIVTRCGPVSFLTTMWWRWKDVTTFQRLLRCMGATHPCLLISASLASIWRIARDFLRRAAHEGVPGGPIHSELSHCFRSLSAATSRTLFAQRGPACLCICCL